MKADAIAVIQARMGSTRLPGKVLMPLSGKPLLWHIFNRLSYCKELDEIIVATSIDKQDDAVAQLCVENNIKIYRGSVEDVLSRFIGVIDEYKPSWVARITGDTPFVTPEYVDAQVKALQKYDGDIILCQDGGVLFEGQDVWSARALREVFEHSHDPQDREHVGSFYFAENPSKFRIVAVNVPEQFVVHGRLLTIDTQKDYQLISRIYEDLYAKTNSYITLSQLVAWMAEHQDVLDVQEMSSSYQKVQSMRKKAFGKMNIVGEWRVEI